MHTLAILLFIVAGLTAWGTLIFITSAKNAGPAIAVTILNSACIVVEILSAIAMLRH